MAMMQIYRTCLRTTTVRSLVYVSGARGTVLIAAVDSVTRVVGLHKMLNSRMNSREKVVKD